MGRIARDVVDAVRDRTDIVDVVSRHVTLSKSGKDLKGLCPFHQEKTPSFHVVPSKGIFHCFGCQEGGDVFKFLMKIEGLSFVEVVRELAGSAGVMIEEEELSAEQRSALRSRATLFDVLEEAASYFESTLWTHPDGEPGREYLSERALSIGISQRARLGYAPEGWSRLIEHLHRKGFPVERAVEAGIAGRRRSGEGHYDSFRGRLMFPIRDERGRVVGFGGRLVVGDGPKYINTTETPLYDKGRVLYGLHTARNAIQRADRAIIVEGYFDVLAMQEAGFEETIATCGTAVTPQHLERLRRMTRNILMLTDGDRAGQAAAEKTLPLLLANNLHGFRVILPDAKDPDEFVREHGVEALAAALDRRESLVEWVVERKVRSYADQTSRGLIRTAEASERILDELRPILGKLHRRQLSRIAGLMGISDQEIARVVERLPGQGDAPHRPVAAQGWKPDRDMVHIFWLLAHCYDQVADLLQRVPIEVFAAHRQVQPAMARLLTGEPAASIISEEPDEGVRRTLLAVVARGGLYEPEMAARGVCDMLLRLVLPRIAARTTWVLRAMERSEGNLRELLVERQTLKRYTDSLRDKLATEDFGTFVQELGSVLEHIGTDDPPDPVPPDEDESFGSSPPPPDEPWVDDDDPPPPIEEFVPPQDDDWRSSTESS